MSVFYIARAAPASADWREAIRLGIEVVDDGVLWRESFATGAFIASERPAKVMLSHAPDKVVGQVCSRVVAVNGWHYVTLHDRPLEELVTCRARPDPVGTPISIGARSLAYDKLLAEEHVKRHTVAVLDELSIVGPNEHPAYPGAQITQNPPIIGETDNGARRALRSRQSRAQR